MLSRGLIVLLLVLNLGVALWWSAQPPADAAPPSARIDGVPLLLLPGEDATTAAATAVAPDAEADAQAETRTGTRTDAASPAPAPLDALPPARIAGSGSGLCYAFGPLEAGTAQPPALAHAHGPVRLRGGDQPAANARRWRVVMPPLADAEAAAAMQQRLRAAGFDDQVLVRNPPEANSIALGLFGSREAALRQRQTLADAGFAAQVHPSGGDIHPALAFELRQGADPDQVRVALGLLRAQPLDCSEL